MKKVIALVSGLLVSIAGICQQTPSCCAQDATDKFAGYASEKEFVMSHTEPLPFTFKSENGKEISFKAPDGTDAYGWEIKPKTKTNAVLFVIQEWWGLNDYIKKESEKFWSDLGIRVIALDMYDRKVATTREEAAKYMQAMTSERGQNIIKGAINYVGKDAKIFTAGWCFGGGWSLQASILAGKQGAGCVMYYGQPETNIERLKTLNGDVIGFFGNKDQRPSPQMVDQFVADMKSAGKALDVHRYDATHAFANPSNPNFNKEATADAYKHTIAFIKNRL